MKKLLLSILLLIPFVSNAQDFYDDDIYYNSSSKPKVAKQKKETPKSVYNKTVEDHDFKSPTYENYNSSSRDVDEYNRRGGIYKQNDTTQLKQERKSSNDVFEYTERLERFDNPNIITESDDEDLKELYYANDVNIYIGTPSVHIDFFDPWDSWYRPYSWGFGWNYGGFSWGFNSWSGPYWSWNFSYWGPSYYPPYYYPHYYPPYYPYYPHYDPYYPYYPSYSHRYNSNGRRPFGGSHGSNSTVNSGRRPMSSSYSSSRSNGRRPSQSNYERTHHKTYNPAQGNSNVNTDRRRPGTSYYNGGRGNRSNNEYNRNNSNNHNRRYNNSNSPERKYELERPSSSRRQPSFNNNSNSSHRGGFSSGSHRGGGGGRGSFGGGGRGDRR